MPITGWERQWKKHTESESTNAGRHRTAGRQSAMSSSTQEAASHSDNYPSSSAPLLASFPPDLPISRSRSQSPERSASSSSRFSSTCNRRASTRYGTMPRLGSMFRRRPRDNDESPTLPTHNGHWRRGRSGRDRIQVQPYTMKKRPTFLEWLKISALDIITLIVMAILSYVVS